MHFVYILKSLSADKSYVGISGDVERRLAEHNSGKSYYTKRHLPWKVVYTEKFDSVREAREKEKWLKTTSGRRFLKKVFGS